ncbi:MAG TPA: antitoxin [Acidobacteria bacterium]|nr:antitoxin [Acidobacteriota bacterium]
MHTKLTLRIDEKLIERAKSHAQRSGKSVSKMVEDYFELLPAHAAARTRPLTPIVSSLVGILKGTHLDEEDYRRHLEEKYR